MSAQQPGQTRKEQKAATRIDLLAAARRTFMSTGVAKTGVGDVAKAAGVAHGTFYVHFENKDAVVREVGPSFISIYDTQWNEIDTIQFNDGGVGFRVMLDTPDDDIYVAYDEMDLYAWQEISIAKLEHYRILTGD